MNNFAAPTPKSAPLVFAVLLASSSVLAGSPWTILDDKDGSSLVHVKSTGAESGVETFAVVVRAGAANDPDDRRGVAAATALATLQGTITSPAPALQQKLQAIGASLDVKTTMFSTTFTLQSSHQLLPEAITEVMKHISNPALQLVDIEAVKRELEFRDAHAGRDSDAVVDGIVFPRVNRGRMPLGTKTSREKIRRDDVDAFFTKQYRPSQIVFLAATRHSVGAVRAAIDDGFAIPPTTDPANEALPGQAPNVPAQGKVDTPTQRVLVAQVLPKVSVSVCRGLAAVVELRLWTMLDLEQQRGANVRARCRHWRGEQMLVLYVDTGESIQAGLEQATTKALALVRSAQVFRQDRAVLKRRFAAERMRLAKDPAFAVAFLSEALEGTNAPPATALAEWATSPEINGKRFAVAKRALTNAHRAVVELAPSTESRLAR